MEITGIRHSAFFRDLIDRIICCQKETGGLKDTVEPFNQYTGEGNGFTFDRYESGLLLDATNRAKTLYFEYREAWDAMVQRNMNKDVSWEASAKLYRDLYVQMTQ